MRYGPRNRLGLDNIFFCAKPEGIELFFKVLEAELDLALNKKITHDCSINLNNSVN